MQLVSDPNGNDIEADGELMLMEDEEEMKDPHEQQHLQHHVVPAISSNHQQPNHQEMEVSGSA